jgi:hypothetical protein
MATLKLLSTSFVEEVLPSRLHTQTDTTVHTCRQLPAGDACTNVVPIKRPKVNAVAMAVEREQQHPSDNQPRPRTQQPRRMSTAPWVHRKHIVTTERYQLLLRSFMSKKIILCTVTQQQALAEMHADLHCSHQGALCCYDCRLSLQASQNKNI